MAVLASEYAEREITEFLLRLNISNECNLIYTNAVSNLPVFLEKIIKISGKSVGIIIPKTKEKEISSLIRYIDNKYKVLTYIFISEKLPENTLLVCKSATQSVKN
ncbi:MAG: hypothetical protein RXQ80_06245 [Sulfolobaceae archaeon]